MGRARTQPLVLAWALPGPSWPILWGPLSGLSVLLAWASLSCSLPAVCIALFLVTFTSAVRLWFVALRLHPAFARTVLDLRASPHLICPHRCYSLLLLRISYSVFPRLRAPTDTCDRRPGWQGKKK